MFDPMSTSMVISCADVLLPVITTMINLSLNSGEFADDWKCGLINPILKKPGLDLPYKNDRPVSNLQYVSKLTEKVVFNQVYDHMVSNAIFPALQSSYRQFHSTETALIKVMNDILLQMNSQHVTMFGIGKFSHITPALYELHWLPVSLRIDYKILLLTFKCIYGLAPTYLSDLIRVKSNSSYNLRSTGKLLLDHPKGKMLTTLGARSLSAAAPKLWNELPVELRQATSLNSFKSRLKTYLFKKYFYSL